MAHQKRYQVFVGSTYSDLIKERQEVATSIMRVGCFPSGMEQFAASNDDAWKVVCGIIDQCDYYVRNSSAIFHA
jgi:hypothetical protein